MKKYPLPEKGVSVGLVPAEHILDPAGDAVAVFLLFLLLRLLLDVAAVALYVYLISVDLNGRDWYLGLAAPIILWGGAILLLLGLVLRVYRRSALTTMTILIGSIGVFVFGMEFFVDRWLHQLWSPSWSLVVLTICIGMVIPLIIIRRVPALREEARRRFHL